MSLVRTNPQSDWEIDGWSSVVVNLTPESSKISEQVQVRECASLRQRCADVLFPTHLNSFDHWDKLVEISTSLSSDLLSEFSDPIFQRSFRRDKVTDEECLVALQKLSCLLDKVSPDIRTGLVSRISKLLSFYWVSWDFNKFYKYCMSKDSAKEITALLQEIWAEDKYHFCVDHHYSEFSLSDFQNRCEVDSVLCFTKSLAAETHKADVIKYLNLLPKISTLHLHCTKHYSHECNISSVVTDFLKINTTVQNLEIDARATRKDFNDSGFIEVLSTNETVKRLRFIRDSAYTFPSHYELLAKLLSQNQTLTHLDFGDLVPILGDRKTGDFLKVLHANTVLQRFDGLRFIIDTPSDLQDMILLIRNNKGLQNLTIRLDTSTRVSEGGIDRLAGAFRMNSSLKDVHIELKNLPVSFSSILRQATQHIPQFEIT